MEVQNKGTLYGVGVGPGDPELLTRKACRILQAADWIAVPGREKEETVSYQIAAAAVPALEQKACLPCPITMTKDPAILQAQYDAAANKIQAILDTGADVAFLTLGDPTVYATYMYLHQRVQDAGYPVEIISGIPSFCAAAARLGISLAERSEQLHVIPSSYALEDALEQPGTKVLMKAGRQMQSVKAKLLEKKRQVWMVENCGMEDERIYRCAEEIPDHAGYFSLLILKDANE